MTKKERIKCVMRMNIPDQTPVSAGLSEMYPVRMSGKTYTQIFHYDPVPIWKLRINVERRYNTDGFIHVIPTLLPKYAIMEKQIMVEEESKVVWREIYHTEKGDLQTVKQLTHPEGLSTLEPLIKGAEDLEKAILLYRDPSHYNYEEYLEAYDYMGDDGTVAPYLQCPADELSALMGGPQNFIMAHFDYPDKLQRFTKIYTEKTISYLHEFIKRNLPIDVVQIGAANLSYSVSSPEFFDMYHADFLKKLITFEEDNWDKIIIQQHTCGKARGVLEKAFSLGLKAFEPIEEPPLGDINLKEVKEKFGHKMSLKGNINSIDTMLHGTPEKVRKETIEKLEIGMPGGGFFLAVGDQTPYYAPEENIKMLVETVHEFGKY